MVLMFLIIVLDVLYNDLDIFSFVVHNPELLGCEMDGYINYIYKLYKL